MRNDLIEQQQKHGNPSFFRIPETYEIQCTISDDWRCTFSVTNMAYCVQTASISFNKTKNSVY